MAWAKCENCNGLGSNYNYSTDQSDICFGCGGSGKIPVADSAPVGRTARQPAGHQRNFPERNTGKVNLVDQRQNVRYFLTFVAFIGGGYYVLTHFSENLLVVGIISLIMAGVIYKWYKPIIIITLIIGIVYFLSNNL